MTTHITSLRPVTLEPVDELLRICLWLLVALCAAVVLAEFGDAVLKIWRHAPAAALMVGFGFPAAVVVIGRDAVIGWEAKVTAEAALNRLAKWRTILTGWQLGTRSIEDPEAQAVRDQRESQLLMRAELSAITALLIKAKVFTHQQFEAQLVEESEALEEMYERRFPGAKATDGGMVLKAEAAEWMSKFPK